MKPSENPQTSTLNSPLSTLNSPLIPPGYKHTEVGVIPMDWHTEAIANLVEPTAPICYGVVQVGQHTESGVPIVAIKFVKEIAHAPLHRTAISLEQPYARSRPKGGDVLISIKGTIGRVGIVPNGFKGNISRELARLRIAEDTSAEYIAYQLEAGNTQERIMRSVVGTTRLEFSIATLRKFSLPLPPTKAEQEAIAEALSDADALIESLEQLLTKKRHLKQGAMQQLLTGKNRLPGFNGEWEAKQFGEIVQPRKERIDPRRKGHHEFCIELEHIEQGTGCLVGYGETSEDSSLKSVFQKDDVLFGKLRAYLRKYWLANREGVCSTEIWVFTAKSSLLIPQFLFQLVKVYRFIEAASSAYGTHMPRSDWNVVKNYEVVLPSIPEQTAIAAILSDMDAEMAALETKLTKARQLKQGMMQDLLTGRIRLIN